ncbi:hypothetical protein TNCV_2740871 [Trichonephila clavipes]|nr:hypothetical protein TNCV_2740871 [Trichonephila clavipes]
MYTTSLSRRESISGESPISFHEDTSMPYSGFEPEPTRLQVECHNHHTGWGGDIFILNVDATKNYVLYLNHSCPSIQFVAADPHTTRRMYLAAYWGMIREWWSFDRRQPSPP